MPASEATRIGNYCEFTFFDKVSISDTDCVNFYDINCDWITVVVFAIHLSFFSSGCHVVTCVSRTLRSKQCSFFDGGFSLAEVLEYDSLDVGCLKLKTRCNLYRLSVFMLLLKVSLASFS